MSEFTTTARIVSPPPAPVPPLRVVLEMTVEDAEVLASVLTRVDGPDELGPATPVDRIRDALWGAGVSVRAGVVKGGARLSLSGPGLSGVTHDRKPPGVAEAAEVWSRSLNYRAAKPVKDERL